MTKNKKPVQTLHGKEVDMTYENILPINVIRTKLPYFRPKLIMRETGLSYGTIKKFIDSDEVHHTGYNFKTLEKLTVFLLKHA